MIVNIYDEKILGKLAPSVIKNNISLEVIERTIKKHIIENIKYLVFYDRIQTMSERELDIVANELHVDFYDYSMSIEEKRKSCLQSFAIHSIKGTPASIIKVLNIFFKDPKLLEWYEYGSAPGRFKVQLDEIVHNNFKELTKRIKDSKKASQHLEVIDLKCERQQRLIQQKGFETYEIQKEFIGLSKDVSKGLYYVSKGFETCEIQKEFIGLSKDVSKSLGYVSKGYKTIVMEVER